MTDIRDEIARTLAEWTEDGPAEAWLVEVYEDAADALMPLIRRAQAEARGEILGRVAETAIELQHTREEVRERIRDGQSADWSTGYDAACAVIVFWALEQIENERAGS